MVNYKKVNRMNGWVLRKERYGKSGSKNPELTSIKKSKARMWHTKKGHPMSDETKKKIGKANSIALKGMHISPDTEFKKGVNHRLFRGGSWVYQHQLARKIMMKFLGIKLGTNDVVHHIDGNWKNNDLKNLKVMSRADHQRFHIKQNRELSL